MATGQFDWWSAAEIARAVRSKAVSPFEVMAETIAQAEALNPIINAICTPTYERAMTQARTAEEAVMRGAGLPPLHGVPTSLKDIAFTKGIRTMSGSLIHEHRVPDFDAAYVERIRAAGAISIGKTTTSELAWKGSSHSPVTGITHNPWRKDYNAGGSSAGAAALTAAGVAPFHQGTDGAGSIRMPASLCGVYGFKPSFGRAPYYPMANNGQVTHVGPLSRTVEDAALVMECIAGHDPRDKDSLPLAAENWAATLDALPKALRIAYSADLGYLPVDTEVADAVRRAARAFEEAGYAVEEVNPGWNDPIATEHCLYASSYAGMTEHLLDEWEDRLDPGLVAIARHGMTYSAADLWRAQGKRFEFYEQSRQFFECWDILLTPSLSVAAFPAEQIIPAHWEQHEWDWLRWAGFLYPFNLNGFPAASCPAGFTPDGLPVGLQIVAGPLQDRLVLQASRLFEKLRPWVAHHPPTSIDGVSQI